MIVNWCSLSWSNEWNIDLNIDESIFCPYCHIWIEIQPLYYLGIDYDNKQIFMKCKHCKNSFIWYTKRIPISGGHYYKIFKFSKWNHKVRKFNEIINNLSKNFVKIYWEAEVAEFDNLLEICGIWYRKSLEYLIKDYAISLNEESEHEKIKQIQLWPCINNYIDNQKIKDISKRAVWIWNDETHYIRKWENKDLSDLKNLINIVLHYIEMEIESNRYEDEMNP